MEDGSFRLEQDGKLYGQTDAFRVVCRYGDADMLRIRISQSVVHFGLRSLLWAGIGLRISPRSMAIRGGRSSLVYRCDAPMVDRRKRFRLTGRKISSD